jgi:hypothetical protein
MRPPVKYDSDIQENWGRVRDGKRLHLFDKNDCSLCNIGERSSEPLKRLPICGRCEEEWRKRNGKKN